jgi:hypothetical protein
MKLIKQKIILDTLILLTITDNITANNKTTKQDEKIYNRRNQ